ncbi:hypothetical protein ACQ143_11185 [Microbacterium sp. MC2]
MTDGPATRYARVVDDWQPIDWWKLEARALQASPPMRRAIAFFSPAEAWRDLARGADRAWAWGCLLTLSHIASFTFPAVAALAMLAWIVDSGADAPVGFAGILTAVAALVGGVGLITERRQPLDVDPKIGRLLGGLHLIPSAAAALLAVAALTQQAADGAWGLAGIGADILVGALHFVVYRGPAEAGTERWRRNFARLEAALDALPADERARIYADLQQAFDVMAQRRIVPDDALVRARDVRPGLLGMTMAPRDDLRPTS